MNNILLQLYILLVQLPPKGERSSEFYETLFELEGVRNEEKGAFLEQNISLALLYNIKAISETS